MMKFLILILSFVALSKGDIFLEEKVEFKVPENVEEFVLKADELHTKNRNARILHGRNVDSEFEWPYVVELTVALGGGMFTCTGSIINTNFVLSARECVFCTSCNLHADTIMVRAGSHTQMGNRFTTFATRADYVTAPSPPHPNFSVMQLQTHLPILPTIQIIRLPGESQSTSFFEMQIGFIAGWGTTGQGASPVMQQATGTITSRAECTVTFVPGLSMYDLCLRGHQQLMELQWGDMGGPLRINELDGETLVGVLDRVANTVQAGMHINLAFRIGHFWNFIHDRANVTRRP